MNNPVRSVQAVENTNSDGEQVELNLYEIAINTIDTEKNWYERIFFVKHNISVRFKLDTGAQCNVIPEELCNKLGICNFRKSNVKLTNYNGDKIITVGENNVECKVGNEVQIVNFQISRGNYVPILGLPSIDKFKLLKRNSNDEVYNVSICEIEKYGDVFKGIGQIKNFEYKIELKEGAQGKIEPCRHVPFKLMSRLKNELDSLEKMNVISKVEKATDFVSSLVMTTKPDGSLRICLDPQYLNTQIKREQLQIPTLDEITSKLCGSAWFSTLDANKGFWQVTLSENSRELTTFNTPYGRYCFNRLPSGLSSSPEVFHRVFTKIFKDIQGVEIYIDDILVYAKTEKEHDERLEKVLKRAKEYCIRFNKQKCKFKQKEVKYLGNILGAQGIRVDKDRIKAIVEMKEPNTLKELLRFLGMINYVSKFIPNVAEITAPLRELNKKGLNFVWTEVQQKAYDKLKQLLCEPPLLAYFDMNKEITLSVDASKDGLGAVVLQENRPVAYGSRALTETEKTYSQIDKESLAVLYGCTKFHQYVYGQKVVVETDHKPLVSIFSKPLNKCPVRLQKIKMALQPYDFKLVYKRGKDLLVADHLSRSYLNDTSK